MPLLGQKIYLAQVEENRGKKARGTYEIPFTKEVFTSKEYPFSCVKTNMAARLLVHMFFS